MCVRVYDCMYMCVYVYVCKCETATATKRKREKLNLYRSPPRHLLWRVSPAGKPGCLHSLAGIGRKLSKLPQTWGCECNGSVITENEKWRLGSFSGRPYARNSTWAWQFWSALPLIKVLARHAAVPKLIVYCKDSVADALLGVGKLDCRSCLFTKRSSTVNFPAFAKMKIVDS